jgi:hypothetical protein
MGGIDDLGGVVIPELADKGMMGEGAAMLLLSITQVDGVGMLASISKVDSGDTSS